MRLVTIFGTRPEIIRLSLIIKRLDRFCDQVLVHTGQNYDEHLSDVFFNEMDLRPADHYLGVRAESFGEQIGQIISRTADLLTRLRPDGCLILGDTNSGLAAISAARLRIPVYHLEAGNRCYDGRVPEEINRRLIDHASNVLMPYTHRSKENLLREGVERERIFVVGNPIYEVLQAHERQIGQSDVLERYDLQPRGYLAATLHRAENVDDPKRLSDLFDGICRAGQERSIPVIVSLHPHTAERARHFGIDIDRPGLIILTPLGFWDFVALERQALCVISDSGTVQEECCIFRVPNITIRDTTERAETIECGSAILTGADPERIANAVSIAERSGCDWTPPSEYLETNVSSAVAKIVMGYRRPS